MSEPERECTDDEFFDVLNQYFGRCIDCLGPLDDITEASIVAFCMVCLESGIRINWRTEEDKPCGGHCC